MKYESPMVLQQNILLASDIEVIGPVKQGRPTHTFMVRTKSGLTIHVENASMDVLVHRHRMLVTRVFADKTKVSKVQTAQMTAVVKSAQEKIRNAS